MENLLEYYMDDPIEILSDLEAKILKDIGWLYDKSYEENQTVLTFNHGYALGALSAISAISKKRLEILEEMNAWEDIDDDCTED